MATVIGRDDASALALLATAGVRIHAVDPATRDVDPTIVAAVLEPAARMVRAEVDVAVPDDVDSGMGAWHVNAVDELHVVMSGRGVMEFVTVDGIVSVVVGAGDVVEVRGTEHRYRPLTEQRWRLRHGGDDLVPTETGRAAGPWPAP